MWTSSESSSEDEGILNFEELDSDEELLELLDERERPKNINYVEEVVPRYEAQEFVEHFRVSRGIAEDIAIQYRNSQYFHYQAGGNGKLGEFKQTLIYLWFVGHQTASFRDVSDRFDIAISTLFKIVRNFTYFLSNKSPEVIKWPSEEEKQEIEMHFRINGEFPGVIGAIDGSHIKIDKPSNDPESYLNRKKFYSIQLQVVCDHQKKIRDLFVGFPGSVHDSRVFRTSPLSDSLPQLCGDYYILGDSGYPCLPQLLTPYKDRGNLTRRQQNFNNKLSHNRYVIEHCFGLLKQKFRQLYHLKLRSVTDMVHFIRACCVLHNLASGDHFDFNEEEAQNQEQDGNIQYHMINDDLPDDDQTGVQKRNDIANILHI